MNMRDFFSIDGPFMQFFAKILDIVLLSIVFCICSLPIITIGANCSALYYTMVKSVIPGEGKPVRTFFRGWRLSWKQGIPAGIVSMAMLLLIVMSFYMILVNDFGAVGIFFGIVFVAFALICLMIMAFAFPLMGRFQNSMGAILANSLLLSLMNIRVTISMVIIEVAMIVGMACVAVAPFVVLFVPGLVMWMQAKMLEPLLQPFCEQNDSDELKERTEEEGEEVKKAWQELRAFDQETRRE